MRIGNIDFPLEVINAQKNNKLVVFAGAGISMPLPSKLPDFEGLANEISRNILTREKNEPLDRFLGRLEKDKAYAVHKQIQEILCNPDSKPNSFHENILSLFSSPEKVKIVTTNQDSHFSTIAHEKDNGQVEIYHAPALPLGHSFHGIVHLHGFVNKEPEQMIFTDRDFGRAYITEGWAARFLLELFNHNNIILFIGYSHNDPVMKYLARGLPPDKCRRYALTEDDQISHWEYLDIEPIVYPKGQHHICQQALKTWTERINRGVLEHREHIRSVVSGDPSQLNDEESDYLKSVINDPLLAKYFRENARDLAWLNWVEKIGGFERIFNHPEQINEADGILIKWLANNFLSESSGELLALIERQGNKIHLPLWCELVSELAFGQSTASSENFSKLIVILLQHHEKSWNVTSAFNHLIDKCQWPQHQNSIILLFGYLTSPCLELCKPFSFYDEKETEPDDCEIVFLGEEYCIKKCWDEQIRPNLSVCYGQIIRILTNVFESAHLMLAGYGKTHEDYHPLSEVPPIKWTHRR